MAQERTVVYENNEIHYLLEQKQVKISICGFIRIVWFMFQLIRMSRLKKLTILW